MIEVHTVDIAFEPTELTIPADTDVEIHVINMGMLEHDFNIEDTDFATDILPGAKEAEETLTVNLPAITHVQILVDGKEVDTLAGHVDLRHPLAKSLEWVVHDTH